MVKAVRILTIFSFLFFLGILLLVYAFLPIMVKIDFEGTLQLHKEHFFYYTLGGFLIINILALLVRKMSSRFFTHEETNAWSDAFAFVFNVSVTLLLGFIGVLNNPIHIKPTSYAYLYYLSPILFILWVAGLIFLLMKNKKTA